MERIAERYRGIEIVGNQRYHVNVINAEIEFFLVYCLNVVLPRILIFCV